MNDAYGSRGEALEIATTPASALHATGAFARAIGLITMELGGQFVGTFEPAISCKPPCWLTTPTPSASRNGAYDRAARIVKAIITTRTNQVA